MNSPFPFGSLLVFGFLSILLLLGTLIRAKTTFIQKYLFPSCLVGGVIGSILVNTDLVKIGSSLETFAYHLFNLSFISIGLTRDTSPGQSSDKKGNIFKGSLWMALTQGITFPIQAIIGGLVVLGFGFFGTDLFATFGFLSPLGFNEGPGQALSFGKVWEGLGFDHAVTIGLTFAAVGFIFAFFIGVPLANWGLRKGLAAGGKQQTLPKEFLVGLRPQNSEGVSAGQLNLHSSNIDSMAFQTAVAGLVYVLTYFTVDALGSLFGGDVAKMLWGFFFFFGLAFSIIVRGIMDRLNFGYLLDPGIQKRITGWSVDYLIVATIPAIQLAVVWKYILPISLICVINGVLTLLIVLYFGRRLLSQNLERMVSIFGTVTGTATCGLLLLRIVDPEFKTSAVIELALMNLLVLPILFPCMLLVNAPLWWNWSLGLTLLAFAGIALTSFCLMKVFKVIDQPKFL